MLHSLARPARSALLRSASSRVLYCARTFHCIHSRRLPAASAKLHSLLDSGGGSSRKDAARQEDVESTENIPKPRARNSKSKTTITKRDDGLSDVPASIPKRRGRKRTDGTSLAIQIEDDPTELNIRRTRKTASPASKGTLQNQDDSSSLDKQPARKSGRSKPAAQRECSEEKLLSEDDIPVISALRRAEYDTPGKKPASRAKGRNVRLRGNRIADYLARAHMTKFHSDTEKIQNPDRYPKPLDGTRIDITDETLVDNIMERLKPSLQKHIGCDIVDMNPGAGVFSSKLHDVLSPRTHVLLEPDTRLYEKECLRPLLDATGSTYKLLPETGMLWDNIRKAFSKEFLPHQEILSKDDPRRFQPNHTLLFVANVGYTVPKKFGRIPNFTKLFMHQLLEHIRSRAFFQQYGLVRMLLWVADNEKGHILPRTIMKRMNFSVDAEISCSSIFEVAGTDSSASIRKRALADDLESTVSVIRRMEASKTPSFKDRQSWIEIECRKNLQCKPKDVVTPPKRDFYVELESMESRYAAGAFSKFVDDINTPLEARTPASERAKGTASPSFQTAEYLRLCYLRNRVNKEAKRSSSIDHLVSEWESIVKSRDEISKMEPDVAVAAQKSLERRQETWQYEFDHKSDNDQAMFWTVYDDRMTMRQTPSLLMWDRREAEPIITKEMDFVPARPLALLDFHPQPPWPVLRRRGQLETFSSIQALLWMVPTHSVKKALKSIAHGAYDWIVTECPSLIDPAKGGARDLDDLKVRCLTQQHLKELMESWDRWPFRPSAAELFIRRGGSRNHDEHPSIEDDDWWEPK